MKLKITFVAIFGFFVNLNAQSSQVDTAFCNFFKKFVVFSATQNNTAELDLIEMGLDTLLHEGETEDDMDFIIRTTTANISRIRYKNMDVYKVLHQAYPTNKAHIIHDKVKNFAYYKEEFRVEDDITGFSADLEPLKNQLLEAFRACKSCSESPIIEEEFKTAEFIPKGAEGYYKNLQINVFRVKDFESDFRIVVNSDLNASLPHVDLYLIHKDFIKEIILR